MFVIAYLITDLDRGGAERSLQRLVLGLDRSRFRPVVFGLAGPGPVGFELEKAGFPVYTLHARERPVAAFRELVVRLRSGRPAILHSFLFHANLAGRVAGRLAGVPRVISSVRVCEVDRPWRAAVDRLTHRWADLETCVAEAVRDYTRRASGIPAAKLEVIRNGVPLPDGAAHATCLPGRRVLTIAHLRPQKGIADLLRAVPSVRAVFPDATFTVVGRGNVDAARRLAAACGAGAAVSFVGEAADVAPFLAGADLFVLPSRWEGCPNAVLEAMAAGLPVVATAAGGTPELVTDGTTGLLVPPASPGALAGAIREMLAVPTRARAMGDAGRRRVAELFPVERMVREHELMYERLLCRQSRN